MPFACHRLRQGWGGKGGLGRVGVGVVNGPYVEEGGTLWELCNKFEPLWWLRLMMPQLSGKMWRLCFNQGKRKLGASCVFCLIDEKIAGENEKVCVKIHRLFCFV